LQRRRLLAGRETAQRPGQCRRKPFRQRLDAAEITRFQRQGQPDSGRALRAGVMRLGRLEIARLDNDRNFPERGVLRLALHGGK